MWVCTPKQQVVGHTWACFSLCLLDLYGLGLPERGHSAAEPTGPYGLYQGLLAARAPYWLANLLVMSAVQSLGTFWLDQRRGVVPGQVTGESLEVRNAFQCFRKHILLKPACSAAPLCGSSWPKLSCLMGPGGTIYTVGV